MNQPDRCRHKHHCGQAPGTEASHWRTFGKRTGRRENESASRAALFVKGFQTACASSRWFKEKETYRKNTQPSIFTVGSQLPSLVSSARGTTKNWFPSQIWTNFITALRLSVKEGPSLAGNAHG